MIGKIPQRSRLPEILDDMELSGPALRKNLRELGRVNRLLGGHAAAVKTLQRLNPQGKWRIADMGCGGGDTLRAMAENPLFAHGQHEWWGYDANPAALDFARKQNTSTNGAMHFDCKNLLDEYPQRQFDVTFFNLFMHHFSDSTIKLLLQQAARQSRYVVINDLQRHRLPYQLFRLFSRTLGFSRISRHDGKLSVLKSFTRQDWRRLLTEAKLPNYRIYWSWAFRWVVVIDVSDYKSPEDQ